jgi:ribosome-associated protein
LRIFAANDNMTKEKDTSAKQLVEVIVGAMEDRKGLDIMYIDFTQTANSVASYFVICHGTSNVHVDALADGVIDNTIKALKSKPWSKEGYENAEWILLDYADVVVHIFQDNTRQFYNIEGLWGDMQITKVPAK